MKWTSGKDITLLWGTSWHKRWQIPLPPLPPPPPPTLPPSALMCNKPSMLFSVLSQAKNGAWERRWNQFLSERFMLWLCKDQESRDRGTQSHALVEMYTRAIKIVIIAAHLSLRGITEPWTAKSSSGNTIQIRGGEKWKATKCQKSYWTEGLHTFRMQQDLKLWEGSACTAHFKSKTEVNREGYHHGDACNAN